ncbi:MAG: ROK family protein [Planctomycetales bacterium]|nr:ROK family protein [Planctomycetales bacterium]
MGSKVQPRPNILVVDVGGTHVKLKATTGNDERREFSSGRRLTAQKAVAGIQQLAGDWKYDAVTIGVPAPVINGRILHEPHNLGSGWVRFDFHAAFGCPVKIINDAAMQALGSYHGDSMLFLGLGTGLGSTMIVDGVIVPMELAHLPYKKKTFEDYVGLAGLERLGKKKWRLAVFDVVKRLREALEPDYVALGGGNASLLKKLPEGVEICPNQNAFVGGFRLWDDPKLPTNAKASPRLHS